jgi:predicted RND superfamily exporter protein
LDIKRRVFRSVVSHGKTVVAVFSLLFIICLVCIPHVIVNYDMSDYLPTDTESSVAFGVMAREFSDGIPDTTVMVKNVTLQQALEYKEKLSGVDGVKKVTWLDDAIDLKQQPLTFADEDIKKKAEPYYKDGNALFSLTIKENKKLDAIDEISKIIGENGAMTGAAVSMTEAERNTIAQIRLITIIAVIFVIIVLMFTTRSYLHPFIILSSLGFAIVINAGSNILMGTVSFVTNASGNILLLAVSLDYSVFLLHRFEECLKENPNHREAMVEALSKSLGSILSSGLTTIIGFAALCFMEFKLGSDLGIALAKGVVISLLTAFVFLPVLLVSTAKITEQFRHRSFLPDFRPLGKAVRKFMIPLCIIFVIIIVPTYLASTANDYYYGTTHMLSEESEYAKDTDEINSRFGENDTFVLLVPKGDFSTEDSLSKELHKLGSVTEIVSYVDTVGAQVPEMYVDETLRSKLLSENYSRMIITVDALPDTEKSFAAVEDIRNAADKFYPDEYHLAGSGTITYDLKAIVTADMLKVNLIAIAAILLVLILSMGQIATPIILVLSIETAIWLNLSVPFLQGKPIFYFAYLIISSIQLGATVDYAILLTNRYREERNLYDKKQAILETISATAASMLTSGSCLVIVGSLLGFISTNELLSQLGFLIGRGGICSLGIVIFVVPGMLYLFDRFVVSRKHHPM